MKAIGIDMGTTTISAVVLEIEQKRVLEARTIQNRSFLKTKEEWERIQDMSVILDDVQSVLQELRTLHPDVKSIGITGQMHGIVYVNREGQCISPLYTWQDGRGDIPDFAGKSLTELVFEQTGLKVSTGYGLVTHLYNEKKGLVPEGSVCVCTVGDYLGAFLTGRKKPVTHVSNAASLGFFDEQRGCFRTEILEELGMKRSILPEVWDTCSMLGTYQGIPVTIALGDNQASFLGSVGLKEGTLLLNVGTGGQISLLSGRHFQAPGIEARPYIRGKYLLVGSSLCGGRAYAILEQFFRSYAMAAGAQGKPQYEVMAQLARKGREKSDGMVVCTSFYGTRVHPEQRGSITNLSGENFTPEGLVYGTMKGMAQELYDMCHTIQEGTGIRVERLVASGNGVRKNTVLQEIFQEMFEAKLQMAPYEEEVACGAAMSSVPAASLCHPF